MKTYARIIDGKIAQIIPPIFFAGREIPLEERFDSDFVAQCVVYDPLRRPPVDPLTHDEMIATAKGEMRRLRQPIIAVLDGLQSSALTLGMTERALLIEQAKQALRDATSIDLSACTSLEEMRLAVKAMYQQLAAAAPAEIRAAFTEATK